MDTLVITQRIEERRQMDTVEFFATSCGIDDKTWKTKCKTS